jgi:DNA-binding LacI/PurR family transcriptional regulator
MIQNNIGMEKKTRTRTTLEDVARRAKVSTSAVSRTFTQGASVSKKTRQRVLKAANELGFRPNILARSLMTRRSELIALVSNAFRNPYVMDIIDKFTIELQNRRLRPLIFNLGTDFDSFEVISLMSQYQVDGVVIASSTLPYEFAKSVADFGMPTVIAFGGGMAHNAVSAAFVDNVEGGRIAARALVKGGYHTIGFLGGPSQATTTQDRLAGFQSQLASDGVSPVCVAFASEYSHPAGMETALSMFSAHPELEALFCADDLLATGAFDAIRYKLKRAIPEVGVIGFNDIQMAGWPNYNLTTIRSHVEQVIGHAIDMLQVQIDHGPRPIEKRIVSCELVVRGTLRPTVPAA